MHSKFKVKESQIPNAGKGLYTNTDISKGDRFIEYLGEIITDKECDIRAERDEYGYIFELNSEKFIDAFNTPEHLARFANDARGLAKIKGITNNCNYDVFNERGWIIATKNIKAGSEILVSYGTAYWKDIAFNIKIDEERALEEITEDKYV